MVRERTLSSRVGASHRRRARHPRSGMRIRVAAWVVECPGGQWQRRDQGGRWWCGRAADAERVRAARYEVEMLLGREQGAGGFCAARCARMPCATIHGLAHAHAWRHQGTWPVRRSASLQVVVVDLRTRVQMYVHVLLSVCVSVYCSPCVLRIYVHRRWSEARRRIAIGFGGSTSGSVSSDSGRDCTFEVCIRQEVRCGAMAIHTRTVTTRRTWFAHLHPYARSSPHKA